MQVRIIFIQYSCHGYLLNINLVPTLFQTGEAAVNKAVKDSDLVEAKFQWRRPIWTRWINKMHGMLDSAKHCREKDEAGLLKRLNKMTCKMFLSSVWCIINCPLIVVRISIIDSLFHTFIQYLLKPHFKLGTDVVIRIYFWNFQALNSFIHSHIF